METNRGKRLSPIRLRGISFENREKRPRSTRRTVFSGVCHARGVTTTLSRKPNGRARHFANFRKIEENDIVRSVNGGSVLRIEKNGQDRRVRGVTTTLSRKPTDRARNKSKKTTKSDPSTGDQLGKRKCLFTFYSKEFRADRCVNGGSNKEPLTR